MAGVGQAASAGGSRRASPGVLAVVPADCRFEQMAVNQRLRALMDVAEVHVIASHPESFPPDIACRANIRGFKLSSLFAYEPARILAFSVAAVLWATAQTFRRHHYKIAYTFQDTSALVGRILSSRGTRWVLDVLDDPALELRNAEQQGGWVKVAALQVRDRLIRGTVRHADLIVTVGISGDDPLPVALRTRYRADPERVLPLCQAIQVAGIAAGASRRENSRDQQVIFYVGWVSALRGVNTLIRAVDLLRERGVPAELRLAGTLKAGDGELRAAVADRPYVTYLGILPSSAVWEEIANSDACCCPFPDREELACVQPVKVLEFLAHGRPVVGSRTPGIAAVIEHGKSGILATPGSAESFADALESVLCDRELAARLSCGARARAAHFDVSQMSGQLQQRLRGWI